MKGDQTMNIQIKRSITWDDESNEWACAIKAREQGPKVVESVKYKKTSEGSKFSFGVSGENPREYHVDFTDKEFVLSYTEDSDILEFLEMLLLLAKSSLPESIINNSDYRISLVKAAVESLKKRRAKKRQ